MKELESLISRLEGSANISNEIIDQMFLGGRFIHKNDLNEAIGYLKELSEIKRTKQDGVHRPDEYAFVSPKKIEARRPDEYVFMKGK